MQATETKQDPDVAAVTRELDALQRHDAIRDQHFQQAHQFVMAHNP